MTAGPSLDSWMTEYYGELLDSLSQYCAGAPPADLFPIFSRVPDPTLWSILLWKEYAGFPALKQALPGMPPAEIQKQWAGRSGMSTLGVQVQAWYEIFKRQIATHLPLGLASVRLLDFGCGWGSVLRYFVRDIPNAGLFGCDPLAAIVRTAAELNPHARFALSERIPQRMPFTEIFDVVIASSVWTHLSEATSEACLGAVYEALRPGGLFLLTIRPPDYRFTCPSFPDKAEAGRILARHGYLFAPQGHGVGGEVTYGETIIGMDYIRRNWTGLFDVVAVTLNAGSMNQVLLTLRRR